MVEYLTKLVRGESLSEEEASAAMSSIMADEATVVQIAGFMVALRTKGETVEEITGLARAARAHATRIESPLPAGLLDTAGTGGDGSGTFNISTLAALVAAAAGARVAKHGNRAASSQCGSADVLQELGVKIDLGPEGVARCLNEVGIAFFFAPVFHPSFRFAAIPRRELGVRTFFNILGPLCNPAGATNQALGVADGALAQKMAEVLARLGVERALVYHAADGMDELSLSGPSTVIEIMAGRRSQYELDPRELGFRTAPPEAVRGGGPAENAAIAREVLAGRGEGPRRDILVLNAAAAIRAAGLAEDWQPAIGLAVEAIDSGKAARLLESWARTSQEAAVPA